MNSRKPRRERPPLDKIKLQELALRYVGRFATTRAKLVAYLDRKVRERGWEGDEAPAIAAIADEFAAQGYIDDVGYALSKARSLSGRGYGKNRIVQSLRIAGIGEEDSAPARVHADAEAVESALRFARRKRVGPYAADPPDPRTREKALAAMVRAGHSFALSRAIVSVAPGADLPIEELEQLYSRGGD